MPYPYPEEARKNWLQIVGGSGGANLRVRLYKNDPTLTDTTALTDLVQANFDAYSPFSSSSWSAPAIDGAGDGFILSPVIVFTRSGGIVGNTIYGYYVTWEDPALVLPSMLLRVERLATPLSMIASTDQVPLRVKLGSRNVA